MRQVLQEIVGELEGVLLDRLEPFHSQEPTLENMASWLSGEIKAKFETLNVQLRNMTLWDQSTQYVTTW